MHQRHDDRRRKLSKGGAGAAAFILLVALVPRAVCGQDAAAFFAGDREAQDGEARALIRDVRTHDTAMRRGPAQRRGGEEEVALYQMEILALGQIAHEHPELREAYLPAMRAAAARLADPATLGYAKRRWGENGLVAMKPSEGHAYLGYINLALGMLRAIDPDTPYAALNDRLTAALAERLDASPTGLIETYPGETWPPDVAAVAGSIGLHAAVTGVDRAALLARWSARFARCAVSSSGYLVQRVRSGTCTPVDAPRGSGTAIASYFLGFVDPALSRRLYVALSTKGRVSPLGFGGVREYLDRAGPGDGNSGPIILGASVGATGYALGAARAHGDLDFYRELFRSVTAGRRALGAVKLPFPRVVGDALLLAMLTANRRP
jgi:hypothetical protein